MNAIQSIILGIIQGLTEFLPVSSSGHLALADVILGIHLADSTLFNIFLHVATLCAVFIVFRKRIGAILISLWRFVTGKSGPEDRINQRLFAILAAATAATVVIALLLYKTVEYVTAAPMIISLLFIATGLILLSTLFFRGKTGMDVPLHIIGLGFIAAFVVGIISLVVLLKLIQSGKLFVFSFYLIPLGIVTFFLV
ncbi:MAG: undecaprenyl-diphosphate phosphatase [Spirochaetia bacterium]